MGQLYIQHFCNRRKTHGCKTGYYLRATAGRLHEAALAVENSIQVQNLDVGVLERRHWVLNAARNIQRPDVRPNDGTAVQVRAIDEARANADRLRPEALQESSSATPRLVQLNGATISVGGVNLPFSLQVDITELQELLGLPPG